MPEPLHYDDAYIRDILRRTRTIAVVGASPEWNRPSYFVMKYLQRKGFRTIPVNPRAAGQEILGEPVAASLADIAEPVDMVDIFRNSKAAGPIADEAIAIGAKTVWMQIGVRNDMAADRATKAGLQVVMDRCPKIEYSRLCGELSWLGMNSGVISAKRRRV
jgi:predicted CoA-binding protein